LGAAKIPADGLVGRDQKFESGSEEEYVIGNTTAKQQ